jgi:predicted PurR-regulated permease PerM
MAIFIFSLWPEFLLSQFFARITGLYYLSAVILIVFLFLLLIVLHFSVVISDMKQMNRNLAQRQALLQLELDSLQKQLSPPARESS